MKPASTQPPTKRRYPPFYEKIVPVALVVLALLILILIMITFSVVMGFFPNLVH